MGRRGRRGERSPGVVQGDEAGLATITERELPWGVGSQGSVVSSEPRVESISKKTDGHLGQMLLIYQVGRGSKLTMHLATGRSW